MRDHNILPAKPCPMFPDTGFIRLATPPLYLYVFAAKAAPIYYILVLFADKSAPTAAPQWRYLQISETCLWERIYPRIMTGQVFYTADLHQPMKSPAGAGSYTPG